MKVIGLTGGVGSGKSRIAEILVKNFLVFVISTDQIARDQMKKNGKSFDAVVREFGREFLDQTGELDRNKLSKFILSNDNMRLCLNQLTHQNVMDEVKKMIAGLLQEKKYSAVFVETALFREADLEGFCDEIWYVHADLAERIRRLKETRKYTEERIRKLLESQSSEEEFYSCADHVIENTIFISPKELCLMVKNWI